MRLSYLMLIWLVVHKVVQVPMWKVGTRADVQKLGYIYIYIFYPYQNLRSNMAMYLFNYLSWDWKRVISMIQNYLSLKEGSSFVLFCLYLWDPLNQDASNCILGLFGKLTRRRGVSAWFHGVWTCGWEVFEYWMISSLKIKLNRSWKLWRNWNVPLVLLERSWWAGFNGIYLVRFGFRMWQILI